MPVANNPIRFKIPWPNVVNFTVSPAGDWQTGCVWWEVVQSRFQVDLTHWGRVTYICVGKLSIIGSDNGLSPGRHQAIIWFNAGILLIEPLETNFSEILIQIHISLFKKMYLKISSGKWRPFCLGLNVLKSNFAFKNNSMEFLLGPITRQINIMYESRMKWTWHHSKLAVEEVSFFGRLEWYSFN